VRNRQKQRALRRSGKKRDSPIDFRNAEHYPDPVPHDAVDRIIRKEKKKVV